MLLNNYAILLRRWLEQNNRLREAGIDPDCYVNGGTITYLTILLHRAWSIGRRDYPDFMDSPEGEGMGDVLRKMYDVVTNAAGGHGFLEAQRNIYEAVVKDLERRGVPLTRAVLTCFDNSDVERVSDQVFVE